MKTTFSQQFFYLHNFGVSSQFEGDTGTKGEAHYGDPVAKDLRMLLQDSVGRLQQENMSEELLGSDTIKQ